MINIIDKLQYKLEQLSKEIPLVCSTWGNGHEDIFNFSFDFADVDNKLIYKDKNSHELIDLVIITTPINETQLRELEIFLDGLVNRPLISLIGRPVDSFLGVSHDKIKERFDIDITYIGNNLELSSFIEKVYLKRYGQC